VRPKKTVGERAALRRKRETDKQIRELRAARRMAIPWGWPWCAGPSAEYHQPPRCEGCMGREFYEDRIREIDAQIRSLTAPPDPRPEALEGELLSLVEGQWVLA
jgi:hypothetical protein